MKKHVVTMPEVGLIAVTRTMLGAGIAFLVCHNIAPEQRRAIGWTLVAVGIVTTVPLAMEVLND
jgi:EamA domain-containing membrane protein RarD